MRVAVTAFTFHIVNIKPSLSKSQANSLKIFTFHIVNIKLA